MGTWIVKIWSKDMGQMQADGASLFRHLGQHGQVNLCAVQFYDSEQFS